MGAEVAKDRATLQNSSIIDARTLENSHKRLAEVIKPGMTVLDVGCGTGAITSGIAEVVGPRGRVIGIDNNQDLILKARHLYKDNPIISFEIGDIYQLPYQNEFDIVTSARVLQWLSRPKAALQQMVQAVKNNGSVLILDYNHTKISWEPEIPKTMQDFYDDFLRWRSDAGMDNEIADHLPDMFSELGLSDIKTTKQSEYTKHTDTNFQTQITIWADVAAIKGIQMVNDGFISEGQRSQAEKDFRKWINTSAESQTMYLLAVEGKKSKQ
ncbi:methyltransferase domain-containing protein [Lederbergia lenta]|uniref:Methyltransferase, UbiE/COQ5 family n=1 Tax=Lederbergia lenta TaxID=1467 RepID=A0A2X4W858_LEDLE|nr:methyltransferase domain-containing protein [Lederbergia lenta]MEC2324637.1 methyltransferase domain-containing protein [Lederbergia lenta]SQI58919.1 methyltransferase, UbiE/COQ5 family [Lederbergia lenta]